MGIPSGCILWDLGQSNSILIPCCAQSSSQLTLPMPAPCCWCPRTHPSAKTSECLEKGSLSSSVSGDSCRMISGARWHSQPFWIRSLFSLLGHRAGAVGATAPPQPQGAASASHPPPKGFQPGFPHVILAKSALRSVHPALRNVPGRQQDKIGAQDGA